MRRADIKGNVVSVHYKRILENRCAYCDQEPDVIRVTVTDEGETIVATLCYEHAEREMKTCASSGTILFYYDEDPGEGEEINERLPDGEDVLGETNIFRLYHKDEGDLKN